MSDPFPVYGANGRLMGNFTSEWGIPPAPDFSNTFSSFNSAPTFPGNTLAQVAPSITTGLAGSTPASSIPAALTTGTPSAPSNVTPASIWDNYLTRGVVIVLGFIFVAVGLTMFASGGTTVQAVQRITPGL